LTACYSYLQILKIGFNHLEVLVFVSLLCITYYYIAPKSGSEWLTACVYFYYSNAGTYNDQVRERSLESAATEFQRRFHISVDDTEANRRESNATVHQVREGERSVHIWKHQNTGCVTGNRRS